MKILWLLSGFRVVSIGSRDQASDQGPEQRLPAAPGVVDELEEAEIGGQLFLRDAPVRPQPGAQQRPQAFGRVDVDLAEAVAIVVPGILAPSVTDRLVPVAPVLQPAVDTVLVGVDEGALRDGRLDHRPDRRLPDVGEHAHDHLAAALQQAQDGRLVLGERAAAGGAPQPPAPAGTPLLATAAGLPLCPATTWTSSTSTLPSSRAGGSLAASPHRSCSVMACTSVSPRSSSRAICRLVRFI